MSFVLYPQSKFNNQSPISSITTANSNPNPSKIEIRVCTNRTCRRKGSLQILQNLSGVAPPNAVVSSCGCLGRCGAGPNVVALPGGVVVSHCGTAARAVEVMAGVCGAGGGGGEAVVKKGLEALGLRKRGEVEFDNGNFDEAESLFSQAIDLKPFGGLHVAYKCRAAVRVASGNLSGALEDVGRALLLAPQYAEAYICQGDAFWRKGDLKAADMSYSTALEIDPSLRRSKSFKARITKLQEKMRSSAVR